MAKPKLRKYSITARQISILTTDIEAQTLDEAIAKSRTLEGDDFGVEDSSLVVTGITSPESWDTYQQGL